MNAGPIESARTESAVLRIAYLCAQYPAVSHTFVLREVEALRKLGAEIATFSIRRAGAEQLLARADQREFESTYAILPPRWTVLFAAHLRLAVKAPSAYLSTLAMALRTAPAGLRAHLWRLFYFIEAVLLWHECRRRGIRHIHVHLANAAADVALLAAEIGSTAEPQRPWSWSFTIHGPTEFYDVSRYRLADKVRHALFVVCISDYARSQLMTLSEPAIWDRLQVIHVGIPIDQFTRSLDRNAPLDYGEAGFATGDGGPRDGSEGDALARPIDDPPMILFIGRQVPEKGQAVLLQAVALLVERGCRVNVTLAGEGHARGEFERLARRLGIGAQVSFPGAVGQEEIHALYARACIFCLPSFAEGIPGVLMEAMAMRLPVVSTRITGVPELIDDGVSGLLVAPGRPDELADALERLLGDPALRREIGANAREKVVREFNTSTSVRRLHELFVGRLSRRSPSAAVGACEPRLQTPAGAPRQPLESFAVEEAHA